MMNNIKKCFVLSLMASFMFSCTDIETIDLEKEAVKDLYENRDKDKWAEEDAQKQQNYEDSVRIAEENKRLYELYLADLREYKETKHPVMFGWFNAWSAETPGEYSNLTLIPDSMDIVSIWGNCFNINEKRLKQMREVQSKGTKVIVGWIVENVGNGLSNIPEGGWSDDPTTGIKQYAQAILDSIAKYGYDGFDIDYEPSYASPFKPGNHCGDWTNDWTDYRPIISCSSYDNKEYENLFFQTLRNGLDKLEAKDGKKKILNINGSIHYLSPEMAPLFSYFVAQSYNGSYSGWTSRITNRLGNDVKAQSIYTETVESGQATRISFENYANFVVNNLNREAGGIGAYHINADSFDKNEYRYVRNAISIMNPPIK